MKREEKGITLVALIITIIILLILAAVSIMAVTGTGLFSKTSDAVDKYENSREKEDFVIGNHVDTIDSNLTSKNPWITRGLTAKYDTKYQGIDNTVTDGAWIEVYSDGGIRFSWDEERFDNDTVESILGSVAIIESNTLYIDADDTVIAFKFGDSRIDWYMAETIEGVNQNINNNAIYGSFLAE